MINEELNQEEINKVDTETTETVDPVNIENSNLLEDQSTVEETSKLNQEVEKVDIVDGDNLDKIEEPVKVKSSFFEEPEVIEKDTEETVDLKAQPTEENDQEYEKVDWFNTNLQNDHAKINEVFDSIISEGSTKYFSLGPKEDYWNDNSDLKKQYELAFGDKAEEEFDKLYDSQVEAFNNYSNDMLAYHSAITNKENTLQNFNYFTNKYDTFDTENKTVIKDLGKSGQLKIFGDYTDKLTYENVAAVNSNLFKIKDKDGNEVIKSSDDLDEGYFGLVNNSDYTDEEGRVITGFYYPPEIYQDDYEGPMYIQALYGDDVTPHERVSLLDWYGITDPEKTSQNGEAVIKGVYNGVIDLIGSVMALKSFAYGATTALGVKTANLFGAEIEEDGNIVSEYLDTYRNMLDGWKMSASKEGRENPYSSEGIISIGSDIVFQLLAAAATGGGSLIAKGALKTTGTLLTKQALKSSFKKLTKQAAKELGEKALKSPTWKQLYKNNMAQLRMAPTKADQALAKYTSRVTMSAMAVRDTDRQAELAGFTKDEAKLIGLGMFGAMMGVNSVFNWTENVYEAAAARKHIQRNVGSFFKKTKGIMDEAAAAAKASGASETAVNGLKASKIGEQLGKFAKGIHKAVGKTSEVVKRAGITKGTKGYLDAGVTEFLQEMSEYETEEAVKFLSNVIFAEEGATAGKGRFKDFRDPNYWSENIGEALFSGVAGFAGGGMGRFLMGGDLSKLSNTVAASASSKFSKTKAWQKIIGKEIKKKNWDKRDYSKVLGDVLKGRANYRLDAIENERVKGIRGNTILSMTKDKNGNFLPMDADPDGSKGFVSQNDFLAEVAKQEVFYVQSIVEQLGGISAAKQFFDMNPELASDLENLNLGEDIARSIEDYIKVDAKIKADTDADLSLLRLPQEGETLDDVVKSFKSKNPNVEESDIREALRIRQELEDIKTGIAAEKYIYRHYATKANIGLDTEIGQKLQKALGKDYLYKIIKSEEDFLSKDKAEFDKLREIKEQNQNIIDSITKDNFTQKVTELFNKSDNKFVYLSPEAKELLSEKFSEIISNDKISTAAKDYAASLKQQLINHFTNKYPQYKDPELQKLLVDSINKNEKIKAVEEAKDRKSLEKALKDLQTSELNLENVPSVDMLDFSIQEIKDQISINPKLEGEDLYIKVTELKDDISSHSFNNLEEIRAFVKNSKIKDSEGNIINDSLDQMLADEDVEALQAFFASDNYSVYRSPTLASVLLTSEAVSEKDFSDFLSFEGLNKILISTSEEFSPLNIMSFNRTYSSVEDNLEFDGYIQDKYRALVEEYKSKVDEEQGIDLFDNITGVEKLINDIELKRAQLDIMTNSDLLSSILRLRTKQKLYKDNKDVKSYLDKTAAEQQKDSDELLDKMQDELDPLAAFAKRHKNYKKLKQKASDNTLSSEEVQELKTLENELSQVYQLKMNLDSMLSGYVYISEDSYNSLNEVQKSQYEKTPESNSYRKKVSIGLNTMLESAKNSMSTDGKIKLLKDSVFDKTKEEADTLSEMVEDLLDESDPHLFIGEDFVQELNDLTKAYDVLDLNDKSEANLKKLFEANYKLREFLFKNEKLKEKVDIEYIDPKTGNKATKSMSRADMLFFKSTVFDPSKEIKSIAGLLESKKIREASYGNKDKADMGKGIKIYGFLNVDPEVFNSYYKAYLAADNSHMLLKQQYDAVEAVLTFALTDITSKVNELYKGRPSEMPLVENIFSTLGVAGSGKTSMISLAIKIAQEELKKQYPDNKHRVLMTAKFDKQVKKLVKESEKFELDLQNDALENGESFDIEAFMTELEEAEKNNKLLDDVSFIMIDEATLLKFEYSKSKIYDSKENSSNTINRFNYLLDKLNKRRAVKGYPPVKTLLLGDFSQNGYVNEKGQDRHIGGSAGKVNFLGSRYLEDSFRSKVSELDDFASMFVLAKNDALAVLPSELKSSYGTIKGSSLLGGNQVVNKSEVDPISEDLVENIKQQIKDFESRGEEFVVNIISDTEIESERLNKLVNDYPDNFKKFNLNNVQGQEAEYSIVYFSDENLDNDTKDPIKEREIGKRANTAVTRAFYYNYIINGSSRNMSSTKVASISAVSPAIQGNLISTLKPLEIAIRESIESRSFSEKNKSRSSKNTSTEPVKEEGSTPTEQPTSTEETETSEETTSSIENTPENESVLLKNSKQVAINRSKKADEEFYSNLEKEHNIIAGYTDLEKGQKDAVEKLLTKDLGFKLFTDKGEETKALKELLGFTKSGVPRDAEFNVVSHIDSKGMLNIVITGTTKGKTVVLGYLPVNALENNSSKDQTFVGKELIDLVKKKLGEDKFGKLKITKEQFASIAPKQMIGAGRLTLSKDFKTLAEFTEDLKGDDNATARILPGLFINTNSNAFAKGNTFVFYVSDENVYDEKTASAIIERLLAAPPKSFKAKEALKDLYQNGVGIMPLNNRKMSYRDIFEFAESQQNPSNAYNIFGNSNPSAKPYSTGNARNTASHLIQLFQALNIHGNTDFKDGSNAKITLANLNKAVNSKGRTSIDSKFLSKALPIIKDNKYSEEFLKAMQDVLDSIFTHDLTVRRSAGSEGTHENLVLTVSKDGKNVKFNMNEFIDLLKQQDKALPDLDFLNLAIDLLSETRNVHKIRNVKDNTEVDNSLFATLPIAKSETKLYSIASTTGVDLRQVVVTDINSIKRPSLRIKADNLFAIINESEFNKTEAKEETITTESEQPSSVEADESVKKDLEEKSKLTKAEKLIKNRKLINKKLQEKLQDLGYKAVYGPNKKIVLEKINENSLDNFITNLNNLRKTLKPKLTNKQWKVETEEGEETFETKAEAESFISDYLNTKEQAVQIVKTHKELVDTILSGSGSLSSLQESILEENLEVLKKSKITQLEEGAKAVKAVEQAIWDSYTLIDDENSAYENDLKFLQYFNPSFFESQEGLEFLANYYGINNSDLAHITIQRKINELQKTNGSDQEILMLKSLLSMLASRKYDIDSKERIELALNSNVQLSGFENVSKLGEFLSLPVDSEERANLKKELELALKGNLSLEELIEQTDYNNKEQVNQLIFEVLMSEENSIADLKKLKYERSLTDTDEKPLVAKLVADGKNQRLTPEERKIVWQIAQKLLDKGKGKEIISKLNRMGYVMSGNVAQLFEKWLDSEGRTGTVEEYFELDAQIKELKDNSLLNKVSAKYKEVTGQDLDLDQETAQILKELQEGTVENLSDLPQGKAKEYIESTWEFVDNLLSSGRSLSKADLQNSIDENRSKLDRVLDFVVDGDMKESIVEKWNNQVERLNSIVEVEKDPYTFDAENNLMPEFREDFVRSLEDKKYLALKNNDLKLALDSDPALKEAYNQVMSAIHSDTVLTEDQKESIDDDLFDAIDNFVLSDAAKALILSPSDFDNALMTYLQDQEKHKNCY